MDFRQKLLKFLFLHHFIKEKRDKIKAGRVEVASEKKFQAEKEVELDYLVTRRELLSESLTLLRRDQKKLK